METLNKLIYLFFVVKVVTISPEKLFYRKKKTQYAILACLHVQNKSGFFTANQSFYILL